LRAELDEAAPHIKDEFNISHVSQLPYLVDPRLSIDCWLRALTVLERGRQRNAAPVYSLSGQSAPSGSPRGRAYRLALYRRRGMCMSIPLCCQCLQLIL
jgi:hypothetical protein